MKWNTWYKCKDIMPGKEFDTHHNFEAIWGYPGFIVCFNHSDDEPFFARCSLRNGKFELVEYCHNDENCNDVYQDNYWDDEIVVTHWMQITWPLDLLDNE